MKLLRILRWLVLLLSVLLAVQLLARCHARQRGELGELYERYCEQPGVRVALVQNMPINDTLSKDILLLTATDSAGWAWIVKEIGGLKPGTPPFEKALNPPYPGMSTHIGTIESPGAIFCPPEGMNVFEALEAGLCNQLLHVVLLTKQRIAWITTINTSNEPLALINLSTERSGMDEAIERREKQ